jgi:hypothetical protein
MRGALCVLFVGLALAGCSLGGDGDEKSATASAQFVTELVRPGTEEQHGSVGLSDAGGKTRVVVEVLHPSGRQVAEIRTGNCDVLGAGVAYVLAPFEAGVSTTTVDVGLNALRKMGYLVTVREGSSGPGGLCGDLAKSHSPSAAPSYE